MEKGRGYEVGGAHTCEFVAPDVWPTASPVFVAADVWSRWHSLGLPEFHSFPLLLSTYHFLLGAQ